jgi:hypothetical protein
LVEIMPRSQVARSLLAAGRAALSESTAVESQTLFNAVSKAGRSFSSAAGRSLVTRSTTSQMLGKTRCCCGKVFCNGHNSISTSATTNAADPAFAEEMMAHAPSLTAR